MSGALKMERFVDRNPVEFDIEVLTTPRDGRVVGSVEIDIHQGQRRPQEALRLAKRQPEDDPQCQRGLDRSSGAGESHPRALPEPYVNLSAHTAPIVQPFPSSGAPSGRTVWVRDVLHAAATATYATCGPGSASGISAWPNTPRRS